MSMQPRVRALLHTRFLIGTCRWKAVLPATEAGGPYTVTATSQKHGSATLQDVLFGDVWICSGQSNMQFTVPQVLW